MPSGDDSPGLIDYVLRGPDAGGKSLFRTTIGLWLWWRLWGAIAILFGAITLLNRWYPESEPAYAGFWIGLLTAGFALTLIDNDW